MRTIILAAICVTSVRAGHDAMLMEIEDGSMKSQQHMIGDQKGGELRMKSQQHMIGDQKLLMRREDKKAVKKTEERKVMMRRSRKPQASDDANHLKLDTSTSIETMEVMKSSNEGADAELVSPDVAFKPASEIQALQKEAVARLRNSELFEVSASSSEQGTSTVDSSVRFVEKPSALRLADIKKEDIDTSGMKKTTLHVPGTNEDVPIFVYNGDDVFVSKSIISKHTWESGDVEKLLNLWKAGSLGNFLDVGGNLGTYTLPISHELSRLGAQTVTVEGMPSIAAHLKASVAINQLDNVALYPYVVGSPDREDSIQMALNPVNKGGSAVVGNKDWTKTKVKEGRKAEVFQVGLTTIDAILDGNPALQKLLAMKMDIEGNEGRALKGAMKLLAQYPPCNVLIELNPDWLGKAGTPCDSVKQQLDDAGYDTSPVNCNHGHTYFMAQRDMQKCLTRCKNP